MNTIEVISEKCTGCGKCKKVCLYDAIKIEDKKAHINLNCIFCNACVEACGKYKAIIMHKEIKSNKIDVDYSGVAFYAEHQDGALHPVVPELIGIARSLAQKLGNNQVKAFLFGDKVADLACELTAFGVDQVYVIDKKEITNYCEDIHADLLEKVVSRVKPEILIGGATELGRSIFPRAAAKLLTGLTADCTGLAIDPETGFLLQTRPAFGDNIMATIITQERRPQMATIRPGVFPPVQKEASPRGEIIQLTEFEMVTSAIELVEYRESEDKDIDFDDTRVIVSVGRGIKSKENLQLVNKLANVMHGTVGASRAAVDEGLMPYPTQIGQTGKTVKPSLYFALGISGAIQHVIGISNSNYIVAVNSDADANIFKIANYGIVGDLEEVVPEMIKQLEEKIS